MTTETEIASLTEPQKHALRILARNGAVYSGANVDAAGRLERVSASAIRALGRRGLVSVKYHHDGGLVGHLLP